MFNTFVLYCAKTSYLMADICINSAKRYGHCIKHSSSNRKCMNVPKQVKSASANIVVSDTERISLRATE